MNGGFEVERCKGVLKRDFLPRVLLKVRRSLLQRRSAERLATAVKPDAALLQRSPLFAKWSNASLAKVQDASWLEYRASGMAAAYRGEPRKVQCIYWVVSGKLTQVPTKQEIISCAASQLGHSSALEKGSITGPLVFPSLFQSPSGRSPLLPGDTNLTSSAAPPTPLQEAILDSLLGYSAAQLVDGDSLILGDTRQRTVRCLGEAVLLAIPVQAVLSELALVSASTRLPTLTTARDSIVAQLVKSGSRPSIVTILRRNAVLEGLSSSAMKEVWNQLRPCVLAAGECVCADMFTAETVYFLDRGQVRIASSNGKVWRTEGRRGQAIGLHSFASYELPTSFQEKLVASAHGYCQLWGVPLKALIAACGSGDDVRCAKIATSLLLQQRPSRTLSLAAALAQVPAFIGLSEGSLHSVVQSMKMRVHPPGKVLVSPSRGVPVKEGFLVLCGHCCIVTPAQKRGGLCGKETVTPLGPGTATFFCEALLSRPANVLVRAETSIIAMHASPGAIMDALEDLNEVDLKSVIDFASEYLVRTYGPQSGLHEMTPQERAASRVKEREEQRRASERALEKERAAARSPGADVSAEIMADAVQMRERIAENGVLTSISLQIQSLHYDEIVAKRQRYFRDATDSSVKVMPSPRQIDPDGPTTTGARRAQSCFTVDDSGNVVFLESGFAAQAADTQRGARGGEGAPSPASPGQLGAPHSAVVPPAPARTASQSPSPSVPLSTPHPSIQGPPPARPAAFGFLAGPIQEVQAVKPRSLLVPVTRRATGSRSTERPSRLISLRDAVAHMKDEADGFNPQAVLRRAMRSRHMSH